MATGSSSRTPKMTLHGGHSADHPSDSSLGVATQPHMTRASSSLRPTQRAGREGFEPSRELYTPYPLSRRVLSATQPPPRGVTIVVRFYSDLAALHT
jgi:hypothetical protein